MKVFNFKKDGNVGHLYIFGLITSWAWPEYGETSALTFNDEFSQLVNDCDEIHIHINSPGGDVAEGLGICSLIQGCSKPTTTFNDGVAFSMGGIVLQSANKRVASKGSLLMFHSASTYSSGNKNDLTETAEMLGKFDDVLAGIIANRSGRTVDEIKTAYFDGKDHYMTAEEALAEGFIDEITETAAILPNNVADFHNRQSVVAAYANPSNFDKKKKFSIKDTLAKFVSPNNQQYMDEVRSVLALDVKADNKAVVSAINAIISARDAAITTVDTLNIRVTDLTTELNTAKTEQTRLQSVIDKFPDGEAGSAGGTDTPPGSEAKDFVTDSVTAKAQSIFNSFNNK